MLSKDQYQTLAEESIGEFRDRGSKFVAYAYPAYNEAELSHSLEVVRKLHPKARHHCYAYRLGLDQQKYRANDDGEPSGTAGRPILGQIDSFGLTNVIIIVIRYFGGTKLGTSGLINAYKTAAAEALSVANIIQKTVEDIYEIQFDYALMSQVMNTVKKLELEIVEQQFGNSASLQVAIPQSEVSETLLRLKAGIGGLRLEEAETVEKVDGLEMIYKTTR